MRKFITMFVFLFMAVININAQKTEISYEICVCHNELHTGGHILAYKHAGIKDSVVIVDLSKTIYLGDSVYYDRHICAISPSKYPDNIYDFTNEKYSLRDLWIDGLFDDVRNMRKIAPHGFIKNWGWSLNSANGVECEFEFWNLSDKTIKYIDFYFSLKNDVGDKCILKYDRTYIGRLRGVGPVEPLENNSWSWDTPAYYTSPDASKMTINKVVLTYMDGTTYTLIKELYVNRFD